MRLKMLAVLAVAGWGAALMGCYNKTPTSGVGVNIVVTTSIANSTLKATLLEVQLQIDSITIVDGTSPTPTTGVSLNSRGGSTTGSHTLSYMISNQTSSPNSYTVPASSIAVYDATGNFKETIQLPAQSSSVATGSAINYAVVF